MSVATDIFDQLKDILLEELPHLSNRYQLRQTAPVLNKIGEEFLRISFGGGRTEPKAVGTSDKITILQINYYRVAGEQPNLSIISNIKEKIIENLPMHNRPYWWSVENIVESDITDIDDDKYEGFELQYEFHTAISTLCGVQDVLEDIDEGLLFDGLGDKLTE